MILLAVAIDSPRQMLSLHVAAAFAVLALAAVMPPVLAKMRAMKHDAK